MLQCRAYMNGSMCACTRDTKARHHQSSSTSSRRSSCRVVECGHPDHRCSHTTLAERAASQEVRNDKSRGDDAGSGEGGRRAPVGSAAPSFGLRGSAVVARRRLSTSPATGAARRPALVREADRASECHRTAHESGRGRTGGMSECRAEGTCCNLFAPVRGGIGAQR